MVTKHPNKGDKKMRKLSHSRKTIKHFLYGEISLQRADEFKVGEYFVSWVEGKVLEIKKNGSYLRFKISRTVFDKTEIIILNLKPHCLRGFFNA